jgi:hypothetical protein
LLLFNKFSSASQYSRSSNNSIYTHICWPYSCWLDIRKTREIQKMDNFFRGSSKTTELNTFSCFSELNTKIENIIFYKGAKMIANIYWSITRRLSNQSWWPPVHQPNYNKNIPNYSVKKISINHSSILYFKTVKMNILHIDIIVNWFRCK